MQFQPPANWDDLADHPDLREDFLELWNRRSPDPDTAWEYMGDFVTVAARNPNYVDPRDEPPSGASIPIPWNGFPRLMSRFYRDAGSRERKERAEAVADVLTPVLYWFEQDERGDLMRHEALEHQLAAHWWTESSLSLDDVVEVARPMHAVLPDGTIGEPIPHFRRQQDEYLEWHADRNEDGTIRRIAFTAEPPDYWEALARIAPDRVLELYRRHVDERVECKDLFYPDQVAVFGQFADGQRGWRTVPGFGNAYNGLNPWTTTRGIMHLTHGANNLSAEVGLAGNACIPRPVDTLDTAAWALPPEIVRIACGAYGGINRMSDPKIGVAVGDEVKRGNRITLTDPVGLYIASVNLSSLRGPGDEVLAETAEHVVRGKNDQIEPRILRYEVELPADSDFTLSDCTFDNRELRHGGQIARATTIQLYANIYPESADPTPRSCEGVVCRKPDNDEIFYLGGSDCPSADDPRWLFVTPDEGAGADDGFPLAAGTEVGGGEPARVTGDEEVMVPVQKSYWRYAP